MAMIKCPKCHHHISSMAKVCPECGAPVDPEWVEKSVSQPSELVDKGEVPAKQTETRQISLRNLLISVFAFLALIIGVLYYLDYRAERQREQHAYELLQDCSNPAFYEDFIIRFPKSKYIDEVREQYRVVAVQQNEWLKLVENGTRDDLLQFVRQHPTSPYVKVANNRIDSLDWVEARKLHTLDAVSHYMVSHPNGYYIDQAEMLRQSLERQREEAAAAALRDSMARLDSIASKTP
ncbi:MAG: hypothetical protein J6Y39_07940 [Bacteroidaceae bacterium]|nr:hypothetical protein [Bacteroidaceae bacterium]